MQRMQITAMKPVTLEGKTYEPGETLGTIEVPDGVSPGRLMNAIRDDRAHVHPEGERPGQLPSETHADGEGEG